MNKKHKMKWCKVDYDRLYFEKVLKRVNGTDLVVNKDMWVFLQWTQDADIKFPTKQAVDAELCRCDKKMREFLIDFLPFY